MYYIFIFILKHSNICTIVMPGEGRQNNTFVHPHKFQREPVPPSCPPYSYATVNIYKHYYLMLVLLVLIIISQPDCKIKKLIFITKLNLL